jgi:hypothetical protein
MCAPTTEQLSKVPPPIAWRIRKGSQILLGTRERDGHNWSRGVTIRDHGYVLLPEAGKHLHLFSQASHAKALKTSLGLMGFHEIICTGVEKGRRSELCLMVLKRCTKRGEGKELLKRHRASSAWVHVRSRGHPATDHGDLSILVGNLRGWEEGGNVEVRFSLWRAWLTCTCALDLHTLDTARKEEFAAKEELVVVAALVSACKIQQKKRRSIREMLES